MTRADRIKAFGEYRAGLSIAEIARRWGVTYRIMYNAVTRMLRNDGITTYRAKVLDGCLYPRIRAWMRDTGATYNDIARGIGLSISATRMMLVGERDLSPRHVPALAAYTGLTEDEITEEE